MMAILTGVRWNLSVVLIAFPLWLEIAPLLNTKHTTRYVKLFTIS
jgi:hypothetical protein